MPHMPHIATIKRRRNDHGIRYVGAWLKADQAAVAEAWDAENRAAVDRALADEQAKKAEKLRNRAEAKRGRGK